MASDFNAIRERDSVVSAEPSLTPGFTFIGATGRESPVKSGRRAVHGPTKSSLSRAGSRPGALSSTQLFSQRSR